jgi:hypothetical protein
MSSPGLNAPFDPGYDVYSMRREHFNVPSVCWLYKPDNNADYACDAVLAPAPELGAQVWTQNGKRILIGVYKDEGRPNGLRRPARVVPWVRNVNKVVLTDSVHHHLSVGAVVDIYNTTTPEARLKVLRVVDEYSFEVRSLASGPTSGLIGGYSAVEPVNFYEQYIVFRYLPSYKLVPWQAVVDLLTSTVPTVGTAPVNLVDINTGFSVPTSRTVFNGTNLTSSGSRSGTELWRQQFDENGKPLAWSYDSLGQPILPRTVSSPKRNNPPIDTPPVINEVGSTSDTANNQLYVKDYYGFELNDVTRGQYYVNDIITYDPTEPDNIKRKLNGSTVIYDGVLLDEFGNFVESATEQNTVKIRRPIMPLALDQFNVPYKRPLPRRNG